MLELVWFICKIAIWILCFIIAAVFYLAVVKPYLFRRKYGKYSNVYMDKGFIPLLGDLIYHVYDEKANKVHYDHLRKIANEVHKYDLKVEVEGMTPMLVFISNKAVKEVISLMPDKVDKISWPKGLMKMAVGSFSMNPTTHNTKSRRKEIFNILGLNSASRYIPLMVDRTKEFLEKIRKEKKVDFLHEANFLTFKIFIFILFGNDMHHLTEKKYPFERPDGTIDHITLCEIFIQLGKDYMVEFIHPITSLIPPLNDYNFIGPWRRNNKNFTVFKDALREMISESKDQNSLWNMMSQLNQFTDDEIFHDLVLLMIGGSETSSHCLCSIFYYLAKFPEARKKLREELDKFGLKKGSNLEASIKMEVIEKLDYLSWVIKEALRMDPPIPTSFFYEAKEDIKIADVPIDKGTLFKFEVVGPHYNEDYWIEPAKFIPDRFDPESEIYQDSMKQDKGKGVFSRRYFGQGIRGCPGQSFGTLELKIMVSYLFPEMDYTVEQELLDNDDIGFGIGTHFKANFEIKS
ncbi:unnamed protein product [Moneuplotes crassus]|uniref:Cytochrome P450 n=1 Tax=Euplotes crassus TaxID=5936 RepID=A0AAD1XCQ6_EUPCR|nr:unnamed protein product [Moneuplotes crassus]